MTKDNETGLFELNEEGVYVDYINTDDEKEAITNGKGTQFFDAAIIPTVQYQVYGLDNVWFWDDEGQNYTGVPEGSDISIQTVDSNSNGSETEEPDEGGDGEGNEEEDTTSDVTTPYEFNKYQSSYGKMARVTITPSQTLKERYPYAVVTINGKEYDLKYLNNPIDLYMDKDYKISINWVWGSVVETFRIICNK